MKGSMKEGEKRNKQRTTALECRNKKNRMGGQIPGNL